MNVICDILTIQSDGKNPTFMNITPFIRDTVSKAAVSNGICVVYTHHTTCSIILQEATEDRTYWGLDYLQQDLCNVMEKIIPTCRYEGQYLHPGNKHVSTAMELHTAPDKWACLNTDAHLRSSLMGHSETIVILNNKIDLGEFASVFFIDWDCLRSRERTVRICILGE